VVRFVAYFLSNADEDKHEDHGLRFQSLIEFDVRESDETEPADDGNVDVALVAGEAAA
jgi:hypothetical protein